MQRCILSTVIMACAAASSAQADLVTITASRDATLYESADGSLANGAGQFLFAGRTNQGQIRRALLWFDLSELVPAGAQITSARLLMNVVQANGGVREMSLHRALTPWTTGATDPDATESSGAFPMPGDCTWLHASSDGAGGGVAWGSAGGDFSTLASATALTTALGMQEWSSPGLLADVRAFASDASQNLGWFLLGDETVAGTARRFDSADGASAGGFAPRLEIEFTPVPAPGALALLGLATLAPRRRRRN
ncbi:MAG: DNRLRE domain-containing protein [Phycisphaerales bacterium]